MNFSLRLLLAQLLVSLLVTTIAGCAVFSPAPYVTARPAPVLTEPAAVVPAPPAPVLPAPALVVFDAVPPKETPPVELPDYAKRGKRLPATGGEPGRAVLEFCRGFEMERDAASYFKRLQRTGRLPSQADVAARNLASNQSLTLQQYVERDWALRRDNNRSAPQKCKVLGGSIEGSSATVVFEADLNGKRQRGTASVTQLSGKWRVRDHGDWSPVSLK